MKPKVFTRIEWYVRCCDAIKRFQKEVIETEESELEKEKKKVKNQIEPDLNEIKRHAENDSFKFLEFVYKKYKPKMRITNCPNHWIRQI